MTLQAPEIQLPDDAALAAALADALEGSPGSGDFQLLDRQPSEWISTYPAEVITCRTAAGHTLRLLCKYSGGRPVNADHRGGVAYEAQVYRHVLHPLNASSPRFFGSHVDRRTGWNWLFLELLEESYPLDFGQHRMHQAAAWLGQFHAAAHAKLQADPMQFLRRYDLDYYRHWTTRTAQFAAPLADRYPWLAELCDRIRQPFELLLSRPQTVVHGEFTVHNVLLHERTIRPVDWESAAVGPGEIDLLSLIEGWPDETMRECIGVYQQARWPRGDAGDDFDRALDAAYVHLLLRGLGGDPKYTTTERTCWRFDELLLAGRRWGLV
jgi:hypothetical protein